MGSGCGRASFIALVLAVLLAGPTLSPVAHAARESERLSVTYVYSEQCLSCQHTWPVIAKAVDEAGVPIDLSRYEITTREGAEFARANGITSVPAIVVSCGPPMQPDDYDSAASFDQALRARIACEAGTGTCGGMARHHCTAGPKAAGLSAPAAFVAGLVAGFNPCLLAVMAFIGGTTLSAVGRRLDILLRVAAFCAGLMGIYLLIGIGLMGLIGQVPGLGEGLKFAIVATLGAIAAWSLVDAYHAKKGIESRSFKAVLGRLRPLYRRYGLPASFLIGAAFGLVKMPCIGGLYIVILGAVLQTGYSLESLAYLVVYNLGVIMPVLALGILLVLGQHRHDHA